jgi:hypothetical protein
MKYLMLLSLSLLVGCSSARPYTSTEKTWLTHAIIGQSLDVVTTDMVLDTGGSEMNGVWWNPDDAGSMLATKFAILGAGYLVGQWKPEWRTAIWSALGISGYGFAGWNTYQMIENDINPWEDDK